MQTTIETACTPSLVMLTTVTAGVVVPANANVGAASIPVPQIAVPAGSLEVATSGLSSNFGKFGFFGVGARYTTFEALLYGWQRVVNGPSALWVPTCLADVLVTLGTSVGVAATPILNTQTFADTITPTTIIAAYDVVSGPANTVALLRLDLTGFERITLKIGSAPSGTATSGNAFWSKF